MSIQAGDIWFQDIGCGAVCDAINGVTPGWNGAEINHCGLIVANAGELVVAEAIAPKVRLTRLPDFLARAKDESGRPRVITARLRPQYQGLVATATQHAVAQVGVPYDPLYASTALALYCSELVVRAYRAANAGVAVFPEKPMTFKDPLTGEIHPFWIAYYQSFGVDVPEGEIGSNPEDSSVSERLFEHVQLGSLRGLPL